MTQSIFVKSGLSITGDEIFQILNNRIRAIQADTANEQVVIYFEKKDNSGATNASTSERLFLSVTDGKEAEAAEDIINALSRGLLKNSQVVKPSDVLKKGTRDVLGVQIPAFTITNTDTAISATATDDFTFTLASATVGCTFSATLALGGGGHSATKTGTISTATDTVKFDSTGFSAGSGTIEITLTNPNQNISRTVSQAATIQS